MSIVTGLKFDYDEPTDIYLYQTVEDGIRKFGISYDHVQRATTARRPDLYHRYLTHIRCIDRREAIMVESALPAIWLQPERESGLEWHSEVTHLDVDGFKDAVHALKKDWQTMDPMEYMRIHCSHLLPRQELPQPPPPPVSAQTELTEKDYEILGMVIFSLIVLVALIIFTPFFVIAWKM